MKRYAELTGIGTVRSQDKKPDDNKLDPEMLETTTLSDAQVTNIPGIKGSDMLTFTCNYTSADFKKVNDDAEKPLFYSLEFSDGSKFSWQGQHTCGMPGKGVNEVVEFTINIAASTAVTFSATI